MKKFITYGIIIISLVLSTRSLSATLNTPDTSSGTQAIKSIPYLRLQLAKDAINTDDIMIRFDNSSTNGYDLNRDAPYFQGNGQVNLCSISSDNINLAINVLPLPQKSIAIRLSTIVKTDGSYKLNLTQLVGLPPLFEIWLIDAYKSDSLDMRRTATYNFNVLKSDTNSYGSGRFSLVIRQNPALALQLVTFTVTKADSGAKIVWTTANEQNYTNFTVQRSIDNGLIFKTIDSLTSSSSGGYSWLDITPSKGTDQYKLKMVDIAGAISYSPVVTLNYSTISTGNVINIYPNPAASTLNLAIDPALNASPVNQVQPGSNMVYNIKIFNTRGAIIRTITTNQPTSQTDVSNLTPGMYIIQVVNKNDNHTISKGMFIKL